MFTGLVSDVGEVERVDTGANLNRLRIACSYPAGTIAPGASIACGGPCLTVAACGDSGDR
ncbi:MAG: riboflavin synthase, partial [Methylocella sp.]